MTIQEEIRHIHEEYDKGNKKVKPSFRYIIIIMESWGRHCDDFDVANSISEAEEKALVLKKLTEDFVEIYEVEQNFDGEFIARIIESIHSTGIDFKEYGKAYERHPMHIAWRTRGSFLGGRYDISL